MPIHLEWVEIQEKSVTYICPYRYLSRTLVITYGSIFLGVAPSIREMCKLREFQEAWSKLERRPGRLDRTRSILRRSQQMMLDHWWNTTDSELKDYWVFKLFLFLGHLFFKRHVLKIILSYLYSLGFQTVIFALFLMIFCNEIHMGFQTLQTSNPSY